MGGSHFVFTSHAWVAPTVFSLLMHGWLPLCFPGGLTMPLIRSVSYSIHISERISELSRPGGRVLTRSGIDCVSVIYGRSVFCVFTFDVGRTLKSATALSELLFPQGQAPL